VRYGIEKCAVLKFGGMRPTNGSRVALTQHMLSVLFTLAAIYHDIE